MIEPIEVINTYLQDDRNIVSEEQKEMFIKMAEEVVLLALPVFKIDELVYNEERKLYEIPLSWDSQVSFIKSIFDTQGNNYKWEIIELGEEVFVYVPQIYDVKLYCKYAIRPEELSQVHKYLIGLYATYLALQQLANHYIQTIDSTISADTVNYRDKAEIYERRAERIKQIYENYLSQFISYL